MGLRSGDWSGHSSLPQSLCLEPRCCSLTRVFGVVVLLRHPFQGHFHLSIRQHSPTPWYEKHPPYFCTTMLHCLHSVLWLEFSPRGLSDVLSMTTRPKKKIFTIISPQNVTPFLFGPIDVFLGKFWPILHMPFFFFFSTMVLYGGFLLTA